MTGRRGNVRVYIDGDASGLDRATKQAEGRFGRLGSAAKRAGVVLAAGLGAATAYAAKQTIDFDASMRNVNSIAQLNERQFQRLQGAVLDLAGPTAQAPKTLADGMYDLVSSGFRSAEALGILEKSAKAATAGLTTTEVSTAAVAAVLNAYHLPAKQAGLVSDQLFRTVDRGVVSFEDLASTVGDVLPFASSLGVGLDQVGASVATMTKAGINTPETMTRIKNVMVTLLKPGDALKSAIRDLGFESGEALIKQKGFQGALEALVGSTDGTKEAVAGLFPNIRALGGALALTGRNAKGAREDLAGMKDAAGATDRALKEQAKSISHMWKQATAVMSAFAIRVGIKVVPAIRDFVQGIRTGTGAGGDFRRTLEGAGAVLGPVAVRAGEAALAIGRLGLDFAQTKAAVVLLGAAAGALLGRMAALGVAFAVSKVTAAISTFQSLASIMGVLRTVYTAQTGITNASTIAILKHAAATQVAAVGYRGLAAAIASTGIGALIVLAGTAIGALMGMSAATDKNVNSALRLNDALRAQVDAMRAVRDIDIDVAQRKTNLASANNAVERAERRVNQLLSAGKRGTLAYREAMVDLRNAKTEQKRATRDLNRVEEDSTRKRQDGLRAARRAAGAAREQIRTLHNGIQALREHMQAGRTNERGAELLARARLAMARAQRAETRATLDATRVQLDQATASGASKQKIEGLHAEIKRLEDRSKDGGKRVRDLRQEIADLRSRRVRVDVDLNLMMPGGGALSSGGFGDGKGSGWPLRDAIRSQAQAMADRNPMAFLMAAAGGRLGGAGASGVDAFTPFAHRFGLSMTSGYRPGDDGYHGINRARDYADGPASMMAFAKFMAATFGARLKELIYTPLGFSIKDGRRTAPYAQADHFDHVHVAMQQGGVLTQPSVVVAGEEAPRHPEVFISTNPRDRERSMGLLVQAAQMIGAPGFKKGGIPWGKLVGSSWDNDELATLAHIVGMTNPGYMAQIAQGESSGNAKAVGDDPGGTQGLGLWQITTGYNDDLIEKYGGRDAMFNPLLNARAAKEILDRQGTGAWYASPTGTRGRVDKTLAEKMRSAIAGKGIDPDQIPVHGRSKLNYEEKITKLDARIARAETTAGLRDDRRTATAKLELLRGRKQHLSKQIAKITKQLRGKLKPAERERLLDQRASMLSELAGIPGDASSLVETLREAGVGPKRLKRLVRGLGIGIADLTAEKPTARDRADLQLARAEMTPDKADDLAALQKLVDVSKQELAQAKKKGNPKDIADATRNLKEAADALRDATPTAADFANRDLALAQLTETLDDDRAALQELERIAQQELDAALATADPRDDIEAANNLKSHRDALRSLDETIQQQNEILRQREEFEKERLALDRKLVALAERQGPAFMAAFAAWIDGAIGGPVQRRTGLPGTPGVVAGYQ